jgi:DNA mismatch endonuclease Vsr
MGTEGRATRFAYAYARAKSLLLRRPTLPTTPRPVALPSQRRVDRGRRVKRPLGRNVGSLMRVHLRGSGISARSDVRCIRLRDRRPRKRLRRELQGRAMAVHRRALCRAPANRPKGVTGGRFGRALPSKPKETIGSHRSWTMAQIRSKNTTPEIAVRKAAHALGLRFRLHISDLPGKPDLVFRRWRTALFVNGCFWHSHRNCERARLPKTNVQYWTESF